MTRRRRQILLAVLTSQVVLALGGCIRAGFGESGDTRDSALGDISDISTRDAPTNDAAAQDAEARDMAAKETAAQDMIMDGSGHPCAAGATVAQAYHPTMVSCLGTETKNQCQAEAAFCNTAGGWHMCTATEFKARGGLTTQATVEGMWIKACVRDGAAPFAPVDGLCLQTACSSATAPGSATEWNCSTATVYDSDSYAAVGVVNLGWCLRLGANDEANAAMWEAKQALSPRTGAVCCL